MVVTSVVSAPPPLSDKKQRPTEDSIGLALGRAAGAWRVLFEHLRVRKGKPIGKLRPVGVRFGPSEVCETC